MTELNIKMEDIEVSVKTDFGANKIVKLITGIEQSRNILPIMNIHRSGVVGIQIESMENAKSENAIYSIGKAGSKGFGVAAIQDEYLPNGFRKLKGHDDIDSDNYGNVLDANGSVMVWIPKFYFKWTGKNKCKITDTPKKGYALHRAFIDSGSELRGIFVDKYECGNLDGVFSSKKDLEPCGTYGSNSVSKLNNNPNSNYGGLYAAVKTRGSEYNLTTVFVYNALSMLMFANNGNKLERMTYHNNQNCGVVWIDSHRYEVGSGFIKLNSDDSIFKVLNCKASAKDFNDDNDAYNPDFYQDIDLSGVVDGDDGWVFTDDKVKTFSMKDITKTCLGIPRAEALSEDSNSTYAKAGIYRHLRNSLACRCGGPWGGSSSAGAFAMHLYYGRTSSNNLVGGRASYVVEM